MMKVPTAVIVNIPGDPMPRPTSAPAQIVADTIIRTIELGVAITDAGLAGRTTVVFAYLVVDGPGRCPGCGMTRGLSRDTTERRVTDVPVVGHPLELRVRLPRYRCVHDGCAREVFAHDSSRLAQPGASTTRGGVLLDALAAQVKLVPANATTWNGSITVTASGSASVAAFL